MTSYRYEDGTIPPCDCGLSAVHDAIRDLCEAVAELAAGTVHLLGTDRAGEIISKVLSVSRDMDSLDQEATDD